MHMYIYLRGGKFLCSQPLFPLCLYVSYSKTFSQEKISSVIASNTLSAASTSPSQYMYTHTSVHVPAPLFHGKEREDQPGFYPPSSLAISPIYSVHVCQCTVIIIKNTTVQQVTLASIGSHLVLAELKH